MKVSPFFTCFVLLSILLSITEVKSDNQFVKLCGREFIRAVIYTCGGSRWRRLLSEPNQDMADRDNYLALYNQEKTISEPFDYQPHQASSQTDDIFHKTESKEKLWDTEKKSDQEKRDLNELLTTACCKNGCKKKDLSSLC
uniref:Insulin-like domain-containing protein n=1 Tax=Hymenochirus boettgeri TaxID=247094 RepID=A0A8T2IW19_9PIPI|nr:hypothetical protein GDO86_008000 [Hymenochirus boettgeri]